MRDQKKAIDFAVLFAKKGMDEREGEGIAEGLLRFLGLKADARDSNPLHPARDNKEYEQREEGGGESE